jgi:Ser-tRNA(Ala) deacylase AlaX
MNDSYMREFNATVTRVDGEKVFLDRTCFYPLGGGLVSDTGVLIRGEDKYPVTFVGKEGGDVYHLTEKHTLKPNDEVVGIIDWKRRYRLMRMHTACHIISAILYKDEGSLITGNKVDIDKSRVDFNLERMDKALMELVIDKTNQVIKRNLPVKIYYLPREDALNIPGIVKLAAKLPPHIKTLRIVEIEGIDIQADGGPHVHNTREIGDVILLKTENKGKNNRRLYFTIKP